jgi:sugar lactone lactonase YvrE
MKTLKSNQKFTGVSALLCLAAIWLAPPSGAQNVTTVAGGFVGDGRSATQASFQEPTRVVKDTNGNIYVTDFTAQRIRKISKGIITTYAGTGIAGYSGDGGPATSAMVNFPAGIVLDTASEIVFADLANNRIRKIDSSGNISTIAGNGTAGYTGDGGPATSASLNGPNGVTYDSAGNLYFSDFYNNVIRRVDTTGTITTYAGDGTAGFSGDGGPATKAQLNAARSVVTDTHGNLFIADTGNARVREVNSAGIITTIAGDGTKGFSGDGGPATKAAIGAPRDVQWLAGTLYISNGGSSRVRDVVLSTGIINTFVGSVWGYDGDGHSPTLTELSFVTGIHSLSTTSILMADDYNSRLRELAGGVVKTVAGGFIGDGGAATSGALVLPENIAFDSAGNLYVADSEGNRIRKVGTTGKISTVAGTGVSGYTGDGGLATSATLYWPQGVVVDSSNNIYISDEFNNVIRRIDGSTQIITTFSTNANFSGLLAGLALDTTETLYVADAGACVVWEIDSSGNATVVAGELFNCGYNGDNIKATSALLNFPWGVAFDAKGNMYVADSSNNRVRRVNTTGIISTFAGNGTACALSTDPCGDGGSPTAAQLNFPIVVALSGAAVYIADEFDLRIRKVAAGIISTYAGTGIAGYNGNGLPALSTNLDDPVSVAVSPVNNVLYVLDDSQTRVRRVH